MSTQLDMKEQEFEEMLVAFASPVAVLRTAAVDSFTNMRDNSPAAAMRNLIQAASNAKSDAIVLTALVLLRKMFARGARGFEEASEEVQQSICKRMLGQLEAAKGRQRKEVTACVGALAVKMHQMGTVWGELWATILPNMVDSGADSALRASSCDVIETTATALVPTFSAEQFKSISTGLASCARDDSIEVKSAAFTAIETLSTVVDPKQLSAMKLLVAPMLEGLAAALNNGDWSGSRGLCLSIGGMVHECPDLFSKDATSVLEAMMHVASEDEVAMETRLMAIEVMLTFAEAQPKTVRKIQGFSASLVEVMFQHMLHPFIGHDWLTTPATVQINAGCGLQVCAAKMERLAKALPTKTVFEACREKFLQNIESDTRENRAAALAVLQFTFEGLGSRFIPQLDHFTAKVFERCSDDDAYVRGAALLCLTELLEPLSPTFQFNHCAALMTVAQALLRDDAPRIQALAGSFINAFFDGVDAGSQTEIVQGLLGEYFVPVLDQLAALHDETTFDFVKKACLSGISPIVGIARRELAGKVGSFMPVLTRALANDTIDNYFRYHTLALECITRAAATVGFDAFASHASTVCEHLNAYLAKNPPTNDPLMPAYLRGWTCMIECMQERALPYLGVAIPAILRVADVNCEPETIEVDFKGAAHKDTDEFKYVTVRTIGEGSRFVQIRQGDAVRKNLALLIIASVLDSVGKELPNNTIELITATVLANLPCAVLDEIRETAAEVLVRIVDLWDPKKAVQLLARSIAPLMTALESEPEVPVQQAQLTALAKLLNSTPPKTVPLVDANMCALCKLFQRSVEARRGLLDQAGQVSDSEEENDPSDESSAISMMLWECWEALQACMKQDSDVTGPVFTETVFPIVQEMVEEDKDVEEHRLAIALLGSFIEFVPQIALETIESTAGGVFMHFASVPNPSESQSALFGLNVSLKTYAKFAPQLDDAAVQAFAKGVHDVLLSFLRTDAVRAPEWAEATCNAMSTALTLFETFPELCDFNDLFQALVSHLPSTGDDVIEIKVLHSKVVKMIAENHPLVAGDEVRRGIIALLSPKSGRRVAEVLMDDETKETLVKLQR